MDLDLLFVFGGLIALLMIPSCISAAIDKTIPRLPLLLLLAGGGCVVFAVLEQPEVYRIENVPDIILDVVARFV